MSSNPSASATQLNESELTAASARLQRANRAYLVSGAAALLFTAAALIASFFIYTYSNRKSDVERRISEQKDRDFETYKLTVAAQVAAARSEGIEAGKTAGDAMLRAAQLEKEAANARLETERIKQAVAWRVIPHQAAVALEAALASKPGSVNLRYTDGDPEALFLASQFDQILPSAH